MNYKILPFFLLFYAACALAQPITNGLTAYYPFSGNANDLSGNGFHGTPINGPSLTTDRFGSTNSAYLFDGINDYISVPDNDSLDIGTHDYTLVAWIKTANNSAGRIFSKGSYNFTTGYMMRTGGTSASKILLESSFNNAGVWGLTGNVTIDDNNWHCIVGVVKRNQYARIYVDGILDVEDLTNIAASNFSNTLPLAFGASTVPLAEFFNGAIDDISIFNRALNAQEIMLISASNMVGGNCGNPFVIPSVPFSSGVQTTCGAGNDFPAGFAPCVSSVYGAGEDYVYRLNIANAPVTFNFSLGGGATWKILSLHSACPPLSANCLAGVFTGAGSAGEFSYSFTSNGTYYLIVDTWPSPDCGEFTLNITPIGIPPANDICTSAIPISCGQTISGTTINATVDAAPCAASPTSALGVWYKITGTGSDVTANLCNTDFDNQVVVFTGSCNALTCYAGNDDACCLSCGGQVTFPTTAGTTYYLWVTGYNANVGNFTLSVDCDIVVNNDLTSTALLSPVSACPGPQPVNIQFKNNGLATASAGFQVGYQRVGQPGFDVDTVAQPLASGEMATHVFSPNINLGPGLHTFKIWTTLPGDQAPQNDTLTVTVQQTEFDALTFVSPAGTLCAGNSATLYAFNGVGYQWSNNATTASTVVTPSTTQTYTVTVTGAAANCVDVDTLAVQVVPMPAKPIISGNSILCAGSSVTLTSSIASNIIWQPGGQTTPSITVSQGGTYYVKHIVPGSNCSATSDPFLVGTSYAPQLNVFGDGVICSNETETLCVNSLGGLQWAFQWSNGQTTACINVSPDVTTSYAVTATNQYGCAYVLTETVQVLPDDPPGVPTNLFPLNGAVNVPYPVVLSWSAATNASTYQVFVWQGANMPPNPVATTAQVSRTISNLNFGQTYNWCVRAVNNCAGAVGPHSVVHSFTLVHLPDLEVDGMPMPPDTAFSGTQIQVDWQVKNSGLAATGTGYWSDGLYLSLDSLLGQGDVYLGSFSRPNALSQGAAYSNSHNVNLPIGIEGDYCMLVRADLSGTLPEANESNNVSVCGRLHISLTPPPDLHVLNISYSGVAANTLEQGASFGVNFQVENQFNGLGFSGSTLNGFWYDRVLISQDSILNPMNAISLSNGLSHNGNLDVDSTYQNSVNVTLPANLLGDYFVHVCTDAWNYEYEYIFENNNCRSLPLNIYPSPKPDFTVFDLLAADTVSNKEQITLHWKGQNNGTPFNGFLTDQIFINNSPDLETPLYSLGSLGNTRNLPDGSVVYSASKTVTVPDLPTDAYFLVVRANSGGIPENNFSDNFAAIPIHIQSPNLKLDTILHPATAVAGQSINIAWDVANTGPGTITNCPVQDRLRFYLDANGTQPVPNLDNVYFYGALTLQPGQSTQRQKNLTLPNGLQGNIWVKAETNFNGEAYEAGITADNQLISPQPITITLPDYPNLVPDSISPSVTTATAGNNFQASFSIANQGTGQALGNWSDRFFLSTSPVLGQGQFWEMATTLQSQLVMPGGSYNKTVSVQLPYSLQTGTYYLCVYADIGVAIYEENENDNALCVAITVNALPNVNLQLEQASIAGSPVPGSTATLQWTVKNIGTTPTVSGQWLDALYLSQDMLFTPGSDILVSQWQHNGNLQPGESYSGSENFTLPTGMQATPWFLFVVTDKDTTNNDVFYSNNYVKVTQAGGGGTVIITYPPQPDLVVSSFTSPSQGTAGQPISLSFMVKNEGQGAAPGSWSDGLVLSNDLVVGNAGDVLLGQWQHSGPLPATGSDSYLVDNLQVTLPASLPSGNYLLLMKTDISETIGEENENNNVKEAAIFVAQPLPSDLLPYNVSVQSVDTIATDMTVNWKVENIGLNPVEGSMQEGVYLSTDTIWDAGDVLFATLGSYVSLGPGSSADHQVTARLEGVSRQEYHVLVKTDQLSNFTEINETNNCAISPAPVFIEVPELPYDMPTPAVLPLAKPIYYRMEVPAAFSGETMRLTLSEGDAPAFNELYLRYGEVPTRTTYDFSFDMPFAENQQILVPALDSGTYYMMAYAVEGASIQDIKLHWKLIPFQLTSITANKGGNNGNVTVLIEGAKFEPDMKVWLDNGTQVLGQNLTLLSSVKAFVTFPLSGTALGYYDVVAQNAANTQSTLANGFEVVGGTVTGDPVLSCSMDMGQGLVVLNALDPVTYEVQHPPFARPNQVVAITLRFENTGTVDVPAPQRVFAGLNGFPLAPAVGNLGENMAELPLIFAEQNGPQGILRPGGVALQTVYTKAVQATGAMMFKLF